MLKMEAECFSKPVVSTCRLEHRRKNLNIPVMTRITGDWVNHSLHRLDQLVSTPAPTLEGHNSVVAPDILRYLCGFLYFSPSHRRRGSNKRRFPPHPFQSPSQNSQPIATEEALLNESLLNTKITTEFDTLF